MNREGDNPAGLAGFGRLNSLFSCTRRRDIRTDRPRKRHSPESIEFEIVSLKGFRLIQWARVSF